jgi:SAM-dependent methyltransferase
LNENLEIYYSNRAKEYEEIYLKPERQIELKKIEKSLQEVFADKDILEIACGTGYWTERISQVTKSILAIDINDSVLEIAKSKNYPNNNVKFQKENLFSYKSKRKFEGLFGGFIWSHIKLQELDDFIETANNFVISDGIIVFIDNYYIEGSSHPITNKDEFGNTYQTRKLKDDSSHLVLKNFPSNKFILDTLKDKAKEINIVYLKYYWIISYKNKKLICI